MLYPLFFSHIHKERIWGGQKLNTLYQRQLSSDRIGESWEISCHENGTSVISNGYLKGLSLLDAIDKYGEELLGTAIYSEDNKKFPLLIKILDASDVLSVQVHPGDDYAYTHENGELGKTEMWYVIEAKPGSKLVYGTKQEISKEDFRHSVQVGRIEDCLKEIDVQAGDVLYIPAGMVHAIGEGILICEIQQNSDTTYRVYDWNRTDSQGNSRELHIEKAIDVIDFGGKYSEGKLSGIKLDEQGGQRIIYVACNYFAMEKLIVDGNMQITLDGMRFQTLTCIEGYGTIEYNGGVEEFYPGSSCLIPASINQFTINGHCIIIRAYVPDKEENIIKPLLHRGYNVQELSTIAGLLE